jgi:hypothetical protein
VLENHIFRPFKGKDMDVFRQGKRRGPSLWRIDHAAGPIDVDPMLRQPKKLFDEEQRASWTGVLRMEDIAREQNKIDIFGDGRLKNIGGCNVRGIEKYIPKVIRDIGNPH